MPVWVVLMPARILNEHKHASAQLTQTHHVGPILAPVISDGLRTISDNIWLPQQPACILPLAAATPLSPPYPTDMPMAPSS